LNSIRLTHEMLIFAKCSLFVCDVADLSDVTGIDQSPKCNQTSHPIRCENDGIVYLFWSQLRNRKAELNDGGPGGPTLYSSAMGNDNPKLQLILLTSQTNLWLVLRQISKFSEQGISLKIMNIAPQNLIQIFITT
jgi:hypothetical protein